MGFSFFSDLRGGPGEIRARQMAESLGGKVFFGKEIPPRDAGEVCVFVLGCHDRTGNETPYSYYDVIDCGWPRLRRLGRATKGAIIVISQTQLVELARYFPEREFYFIPQHHCNFDRELRTRTEVTTVGCIGGDSAVQWPHEEVGELLKSIGLSWKFETHYHRRWRVVEFYKTIDIQISYRPAHPRGIINHMNVLKLSNAGSFGIPTVAFPEPAYVQEWQRECLWGDTMRDIIAQVKRLKESRDLYTEMSEKALRKAEPYHIENIAQLYRELPGAR